MQRPTAGDTQSGRVGWYVRRLRAMSLPEVAWRVGRHARTVVGQRFPGDGVSGLSGPTDWHQVHDRFRAGVDRPLLLDRDRASAIAAREQQSVDELVAAAETALVPEVSFFGYPAVRLDRPVDWSHDPVAGFRWPALPAARIDHRSAAADPKWIWELNRLQHLCLLAEAWLFTGRDEFAAGALEQLDSWLVQNPPGVGIAWRGAYEVGLRAISVSLTLQGLRDAPGLDVSLFRRAVEMLAQGADYCWHSRSRFSSANNHLVGEMTGLFVVAAMFPELEAAPVWERRALRTLTDEASRQVLPDGAGAEQAVGYQIYTADLLAVVVTMLRARGDAPPEPLVAAIDRGAGYLATLVDGGDPAPRHGDDDDGFALRLDAAPVPTVRRHLGVAATLTGNPLAVRNGDRSLTSAWLAAVPGMPEARPASADRVGNVYAADGGTVVLRAHGRRVMMDVGPLGYRSIAAHGHADALSVTLSSQGRDLVVDPGTGSYYAHPEWRRVFRGTQAHATVTVDDRDQSEAGGPFLWTRHARVRVRHVDLDAGVVDAEHDGYRHLAAPVTHRRWLVAPPDGPSILVLDLVHGEGDHHVRASWPLHPRLDVQEQPGGHLALEDGEPALLLSYASAGAGASGGPDRHAERGDEASQRGWWSDRLESRTPSWWVSATWQGPTPVALATLLTPAPGRVEEFSLRWDQGLLVAGWADGSRVHEVSVDPASDGSVSRPLSR